MTVEYDFDNLIKQLKVSTDPRLDVRVESLIEQSKKYNRSQLKESGLFIHLHSHMTKYAAAVILLAAGLISLKFYQNARPSFYTINQTIEALNTVSSVQMPVTNSMGSEMIMSINPLTGKADRLRMENPDTGEVTITIPGRTYACNQLKNEVTLLPQEMLSLDLNFKRLFSSIVENNDAIGGKIEILHAFSELAGKEVIFVNILRKNRSIAGKVLIDPKSRLPIYIGIDAGGQLSYIGPIRYNVEIEEDTFKFIIPEDAKVIDMLPEDGKKPEQPEPPADSFKKVTPYGRHGRVSFEEEE